MKRYSQKLTLLAAAAALVAMAGLYLARHDLSRVLQRATLPRAVEYNQATASVYPSAAPAAAPTQASLPSATATPTLTALPSEVNLAVPFTAQAPHANWEPPYKEFCEEASVLMAVRYLQNESIPSPEAADAAMLEIKAFEEDRFGYYEDTTAAETAIILREHFGRDDVAIVEAPTATDIKQALAAGKLVIMPAAGQQLGNPYFRPPGPPYHMLVIKGYTDNGQFIVNDPGTRRGADYVYEEAVLMNAIHDWRSDGKVEQGRKVVLVVG